MESSLSCDYVAPTIKPSFGRPTLVKADKYDVLNDAKALRSALKFFTRKQPFIDVLCKRTNTQRLEIVKSYKTSYDRDLMDDVITTFRGDFRDLLVALLMPTKEFYCSELYNALCHLGTCESTLIEVLCTLSNREMNDVSQRYVKNYGRTLEKDLKSDTSGSFRKLLVVLSNGMRDESGVVDLYAARGDVLELKKAGIDRWGTDTSTFSRILSLRNFDQIRCICQEYEFMTGHCLENDIKKEFSGSIKDGLLAIVRCANNRPAFLARCLYKTMAGLGTDDRSLIHLIVTRCEIDMQDIKEEFFNAYGHSLKSFIHGDTSGFYRKALLKLIGE